MRKILVLNGPNLSKLGSREPDIYGKYSLPDIENMLIEEAKGRAQIDIRQSDSESELISWLHEALENNISVIINPAAFTHYSYALRDAAAMLYDKGIKLIEIHITNPHRREKFRHDSVISGVASGVIAGFGADSYRLALLHLLQ